MRTLCCLLLAAAGLAGAARFEKTFEFRRADFTAREQDGFAVVTGAGMDVLAEPGAPQLPSLPLALELPGPALVRSVRVEAQGWQELAAGVPFPAQRQVPLATRDAVAGVTAPDPARYAETWPAAAGEWTGTGRRGGQAVVDLALNPVRWNPALGRTEFAARVRVQVEYEPQARAQTLDAGEFEYVIVTAARFDTVFQRFADWKTQKGVPAVVRDIAWVLAGYPGRDDAERLRNYLKTLPDSGVAYVLLGGDVQFVPHRLAFAMVSDGNIHDREDSLPCDLYFADLDGDWDANGNNVFGEVADSVDLYPDLHVGRAPVNTIAQARAFVNKVLEYERGPAEQRQDRVLFFAEVLWDNPYTDGGRHKDRLEAQSFASGYEVTKLYQRLGNESRASVMAAMRAGQNAMNHDGHGWIDVMSCGGWPYLKTGDADTITNAYRGILYSIGCWTTAFDYTSIGEAFVVNPNGGTVATIGHSSYGWGSPGNPGFGYSDKFDDRFWYELVNRGNKRLGPALDAGRAFFVPFSRQENVYRWHQYQLNLMGCPEMPAWTAVPGELAVTAPAALPAGPTRVLVTVASGGRALPGALVCLAKDGESYGRARTDAAGRAWLETGAVTAGSFTLTVTAANHLPSVRQLPVGPGAFINLAGWEVNDSLGNDDGIPNPGETVLLPVVMHNAGDAASSPARLALRTAEPGVVIIDSLAQLAALAPGESLRLANAFEVLIPGTAADGRLIEFELVVQDGQVFGPVLLVGEPRLATERYFWTRPPALPGESKAVRLAVRNTGHGYGHRTSIRLNSLDAHITIAGPDSIAAGELGPGELCVPADSFEVGIAAGCPPSYRAAVEVVVACAGGEFRDTLELLVGNFGFSDDMEAGEDKWSHGGTRDRWHISTHRARSGSHSWYCGNPADRRYENGMNAWLRTVPFMVAENCSLHLWRWFSVPNYGVDGIYVIARHGAAAETLDFIGTGGALDPGLDGIWSDWCEESYDLGFIPAGETAQVEISFKSDNDGDVGEGFYIDDVRVTGGDAPLTFISDRDCHQVLMRLAARPNPFRGRVVLALDALPDRRAAGAVYDAAGRQVRAFSVRAERGRASWTWDGRNEAGRALPAGAYFARVRSGSESAIVRVVLTR
ncbi:MAG: C25 family cysteine peptidase [bacterium]